MVADQYYFEPGEKFTVLLPALHRDAKVWGPDAEEFKPERMGEAATKLLDTFGNGSRYHLNSIILIRRACMGRLFGWQQAIAMILQRFDLVMADRSFNLKI